MVSNGGWCAGPLAMVGAVPVLSANLLCLLLPKTSQGSQKGVKAAVKGAAEEARLIRALKACIATLRS